MFTIRVKCCIFLNLYGHYILRCESFLTIFSLKTQQIEVRLVEIKSAYFSPQACTPFHFFANTPFNLSNNEKASSFSFLVNSTTFIPCLCSINMQLNTTEKLQEHVSFLQRKTRRLYPSFLFWKMVIFVNQTCNP